MDTEKISTEISGRSELKVLKERLSGWNKDCRDLFVDLRHVVFKASDDDMYLEYPPYDKAIYFKYDPDNPRDPKVLHAQKQFCKFIGVPHGFFMNNRPSLRENIVSTWQAGLNADAESAQCIIRLRESKNYSTIRAFLKADCSPLCNHELISILLEMVAEPMSLEFSNGDDKDDLILHARLLLDQKFELLNNPVCLGFSLITSELGSCPLSVQVLLHDITSKTSFIISYGGKPFFETKYTGIQASEIREMFPKMIQRISEESPEILDYVINRVNSQESIEPAEECGKVINQSSLPAKFKKAIYHEAVQAEDKIKSPYDFAKHMCLVAKDFDCMKRIKIERAAGTYLNLVFPRN